MGEVPTRVVVMLACVRTGACPICGDSHPVSSQSRPSIDTASKGTGMLVVKMQVMMMRTMLVCGQRWMGGRGHNKAAACVRNRPLLCKIRETKVVC